MARGEYATACSRFTASHVAEPAVGTRLNIALCKEKLGLLVESVQHYEAVLEKLDAKDRRYAIAQRSVETLQARLVQLTIRVAPNSPAGTQVRRNDVLVTAAELGVATKVDPGTHDVRVTAPGYKERRITLTLVAGGIEDLSLSPGAAVPAGAADTRAELDSKPTAFDGPSTESEALLVPAPGQDASDSDATRSWQRPAGYTVGAIGIAGLIVGGVAGAMTLDKAAILNANTNPDGTCNPTGCAAADSGKTLLAVTIASVAAGVVGTGLGAYWLITADDGSTTSATVGAAPMPGGGGVFVSGTF